MKKIIERYAEGESSLDEEHSLRDWATDPESGSVDELAWAQLMRGISQAKEAKPEQPWEIPSRLVFRILPLGRLAAAASIVLVLATSIYTLHRNYQKRQAQMAYEQTLAAFELVSIQMQKANNSLAYLETYEQTKNKLFK